ncbi:polysaccharide biosynthesis protein [Nocardioides sp. SYSU DS0651]|uniref:polysaccharide biosynthesis protein n=1 Tax=Nocardioides sp. SYSU DS0651 TaxID=3415955 RepID=UPI003F4B6A83
MLVSTDVLSLGAAFAGLLYVRYSEPGAAPRASAVMLCGVAIGAHLGLGWLAKIYRGRSLVGNAEETVALGTVALAVGALTYLANHLVQPQMVARTVAFGAPLVGVALMVLARAGWRAYALQAGWVRSEQSRRTVIVGAGEGGRQLVSSMVSTANSPFLPVAFLDDDPWRRHFRFKGVAVRGTLGDLESVVARDAIDTVVVAIPSADSELIAAISDRCARLDVDLKVLPPVEDLFEGKVSIRDVRDIDIADILGRSAIETDLDSIAHFLNGKRVLVTGAGGSIGSELSRQISRWHPAELMMLDRDESGLHGVQLSLHGRALLDSPDVILCDIRDAAALQAVFEARRPEVVLHAAALKHLPMLEQYPLEAVKTNVMGTANVLMAAERAGVERFVNISTDKAADPVSVLGFSKRIAERLTADFAARAQGTYISVRFGNVLGSRGSVLTTFAAQIANGGPVTVTHPDVTRYFMTVGEAVQLVLQAGAVGRDGEVLILDMGEPVRIDDVARELIRQSGRQIDLVYTGLREGEKREEILRSRGEHDHRPSHPLISHVTVPPVSVEAARRLPTTGPSGEVVAALRNLALQPQAASQVRRVL